MKPEPLKNKLVDENVDLDLDELYFKKKDIKSAVEWLKEWTKNDLSDGQKKFTLEAINKAFEDVIKK